jgi:hypothetical protein
MRATVARAFTIFSLLSICAHAGPEKLSFPVALTPYAQARAQLLKQGVRPVPEKANSHDRAYKELDCATNWGLAFECRAVFIYKESDGWKVYVVVYTNKDEEKSIISADYAARIEGLIAIPPPIPPNMPTVRGNYLRARLKLRQLGFKPAQRDGQRQWICLDRKCNRHAEIREAECAVDIPICEAYWTAPDGKALRVTLVGETNPRIYFMDWISQKDLRRFLQ